jgi:hypothetical protein
MQATQKKTDHTYKIKTEYCECTHNPLNTKIGVTMEVKYLLNIAPSEEAIFHTTCKPYIVT